MDLAALGPFFELQDRGDGGPWRPLRDLEEGPVLDERTAFTADVLGRLAGTRIEQRVAASTMSLGLFARLVAPVLGASVSGATLPALSLDHTYWQPGSGGPWPLAMTGAGVTPDPELALLQVVVPLADVMAERYALSQQVLRGNMASGVFGAVRMVSAARPDLAEPALDIGRSLLEGPLTGVGRIDRAPEGAEFVRASCCLYYRIPGGGYCSDCVLVDR